MNTKCRILALLLCCSGATVPAAAQHFLGVTGGYSLSTQASSLYEDFRNVRNWRNVGIVYKYYRPKWVGLQAGINYTERGFQRDSIFRRTYPTIEIPVVSQFHVEFWKLRAMANAGVFAAYALSGSQTSIYPPGVPEIKEEYVFKPTDNRFDYGLRFGGGLGLLLPPLEIQLEFNYAMGLGHVHDPKIAGEYTIYHRLTQMIFSAGVLIAL